MGEIAPIAERANKLRSVLTDPKRMAEFQAAMPSVGLTAQRFVRAALTACTVNPDLYNCTPESMIRSLIVAAQFGLAPTGKGGVYLIPFNNRRKVNGQWVTQKEVTPIVDYRGLLQIARRSGLVDRVTAKAVYPADTFEYEEGATPILRHVPNMDAEPKDEEITHVYAVAHLKGAHDLPVFVVLTRAQVQKFRARSKAPDSPAWTQDWAAMACKTALRRLCEGGHLPLQDGDQRLLELMQGEDKGFDISPHLTDADIPTAQNVEADVSDTPAEADGPPLDEPQERTDAPW